MLRASQCHSVRNVLGNEEYLRELDACAGQKKTELRREFQDFRSVLFAIFLNTCATTRSQRSPMNGNACFDDAPTRWNRLLRTIARPRNRRTFTFCSVIPNAAAVSAVLNSSMSRNMSTER